MSHSHAGGVRRLAGDTLNHGAAGAGSHEVLKYMTRSHSVRHLQRSTKVELGRPLPAQRSIRRKRACVQHMPLELMDAFTVHVDVLGSDNGLREELMSLLIRQSVVLLKHLKTSSPQVERDWNSSLELLASRKYDINIFKGEPKKDGAADIGDGSKAACQLSCKEDPALRLLQGLVQHLLPSGYHIAEVEDVLTGRGGALEAYAFFDLGSYFDQLEHIDSSLELGIGQEERADCGIHAGNLELIRKGMPPVTLWIPQSSPSYRPVSVAVFAQSSDVVLACFTFRQEEYEALLGAFEGSDEEFSAVYMSKLSQHLKETFPHLAAIPLKGHLVTPGPEDALLIHGFCVHCGTGDAGYRLVATADPPVASIFVVGIVYCCPHCLCL